MALRLNATTVTGGFHRKDPMQKTYELVVLLHEAGASDYSIHLDRETNTLFGVLTRPKDHTMASLPDHPIMKKWWAHMADIMATNPDNSPIQSDLVTVFHLP